MLSFFWHPQAINEMENLKQIIYLSVYLKIFVSRKVPVPNHNLYYSKNNLEAYPVFSQEDTIMFSNTDGISLVPCVTPLLLLENSKAKPHEDSLKGKERNVGRHSPVMTSCEGRKAPSEEWAWWYRYRAMICKPSEKGMTSI